MTQILGLARHLGNLLQFLPDHQARANGDGLTAMNTGDLRSAAALLAKGWGEKWVGMASWDRA